MRLTTAFTVGALVVTVGTAAAQTWQPPSDSQRCPSKWGKGDQRGAGNHMKPETVLRAARLIKTGEVFELGRVLSETMPMPAGRRFEILTKRTRNDPGTNHRGSNEELVVSEIGQVGTQFDTFSHQMIGASMYNCFTLEETASRTGFTKLGVEQVGALITRGVLIDVAALKRVPVLAENYEITPQDLQQALAEQKLTLQPGDAVLVHTGWGTLWGKDDARYQRVSPGSALPLRSGWRNRIRCSSAPTTAPSRSHRTPTRSSLVRSIRSCSSSTASICWRTCVSMKWHRGAPTSSPSWSSRSRFKEEPDRRSRRSRSGSR
jgi:hypothetical protein